MKKEIKSITIVCDCCGDTFVNGYDFSCYVDDANGNQIEDEALTSGWVKIGDKHYCDDCYDYDDDGNVVTKDGHKYDVKN